MASSTAVGESLWVATSRGRERPSLAGVHGYDVVVVGAGITGITTALLLKRAGARVAVLEMGRVCEGVSGYTTAKVTSLHQLVYAELASSFGEQTARVYGAASEAAIERIAGLVGEFDIDCAFERRAAVTYTLDVEQVARLEAEAQTAAGVGLPARFVTETDLPFAVAGAVRFDNQAQFHPRDYVLALADQVEGGGCAVYERSRVVDVRDGSPCAVQTPEGVVEADHVVVATHLPLLDRGLFFAMAHPSRSYALAARVDGVVVEGMYINVEQPTRSVRPYVRRGQRMLIVSGEGHKPGEDDDQARRWESLAAWAGQHFPVTSIDYRWSAQDYMPVDRLPYVGRLVASSPGIWTATGFRKWGMTWGTAAAMILADRIQGRANPWAQTFDPDRLTPTQSVTSFVSENLDVARHFVGDRLGLAGRDALAALAPGEGVVIRLGTQAYAVSRDERGDWRSLSPVCTHMGCHVRWNTAERSWDCPCHGSRYAADGTVIHGPAVRDLDPKPLPDPD